MNLNDIQRISRVKARAEKIIQEKYKGDARPRRLNGVLLLRAIQYIVFDYIYKISPSLEHRTVDDGNVARLAHWIHLRAMFVEFTGEWDELVDTVREGARSSVLGRVGADEAHPFVFVFDCLVKMKELHVRHPKQTPASSTGKAQRCFNVVDNSECVFGHSIHGKKEHASLIFTPLPSDADYTLMDPNEGDSNFRLRLFVDREQGTLDRRYDVPDQFNVIMTPEWGKMCRLLHNIFHLYNYINADVLRVVHDIREKEALAAFPALAKQLAAAKRADNTDLLDELHARLDEVATGMWMDADWETLWAKLVTEKFAGSAINQFRKLRGVPDMVTSIAQILNVVNGALKLAEKI